jgi:hypothetical protein
MSTLWNSITGGLRILGFWQTYVVAVGMTVIVVFPKLYLALLKDRFMYGDVRLSPTLIWYLIRHHWIDGFSKLKDRAYKGDMAGGFKGVIVVGFAEFVGDYFAILTLLPLMLGTGTDANWALPWLLPFYNTVVFLKIVGALLLTIIVVAQLPIVGEMLIYPLSVAVVAHFLGVANTVLVPGFWLICAIVLSGVAVRYAVIGLGALVVAVMPAEIVFSQFSVLMSVVFFCLLPVLNLLPAFIYSGWLSHQL